MKKLEHNIGFARLDIDRRKRCGLPEVVFCPGKTPAQVAMIMKALARTVRHAFATRASMEQLRAVRKALPRAVWHENARAITFDTAPLPRPKGMVAIVCAGTSDIPVAAEASLTAERMGARVVNIWDVGVAGIHRVMFHLPRLRKARAIVVVAGMEGALPSVVGGLVDAPIIAVPTSIGYGTSMKGLAALLAMMNSCVPGIAVVNIDNGFGAGVAAARINKL